ncbi:glucosamine 6-phosphate N-acetyltransferase [Typha latifolia]|uniref:glucosamine 6-phosphate N-acetyltransferase n=1 Tax=Typha latifolia TaxID=4733 RepID=UPI003C2AB471
MESRPPGEREKEKAEGGFLLPIRRLEMSDRSKGFIDLLGQLSPCSPLSDADFLARFAELASLGDDHVILVIEDPRSGRIVATGTVFVEKKFLRGCGKVGHIEDVVIDAAARGLHLGQRIVGRLVDHARASGCYKVILDCTAELRAFYEKCGFEEKNVQMARYF